MKMLYELRIIDLPASQWTPVQPWSIRAALALLNLMTTIAIVISEHWLNLKQMVIVGRDAIRVVGNAGRVAGQVIWEDLTYGVGRLLMGNRLEGVACA